MMSRLLLAGIISGPLSSHHTGLMLTAGKLVPSSEIVEKVKADWFYISTNVKYSEQLLHWLIKMQEY